MKVPLAWNDKTLLHDEPFLNAFSRRAKAREGPKKDHEAWRTRVMTNLQRQDGIRKVVQRWYSLLPKDEQVAHLRREEIIGVFFDFYHILSNNVEPGLALTQALTKHGERQSKTSGSSPLRTLAEQQPAGAFISCKNPPLKVQEPPPQRPVPGPSHIDSIPTHQFEHRQPTMSCGGHPPNAIVKIGKSLTDDDLPQKSGPTKRRTNESLPRANKKQRMIASFDSTSQPVSRRLRGTKERAGRAVGSMALRPEPPDRRSTLHPRPTEILEREGPTKKAKKELIENIASAQGTRHIGIEALPSKVVSHKNKRTREQEDDLDDNFDKNFAKRKSRIDPGGRTIPSAPLAQSGKKPKRKRKKFKKSQLKFEEGPATSNLQATHPLSLRAIDSRAVTSAVLDDHKALSFGAAAVKAEDSAPPVSSEHTKTSGWRERLRNRGPNQPNYSIASSTSRARPAKQPRPANAFTTATDCLDAVVSPGISQPNTNSTSTSTAPMTKLRVLTTITHSQATSESGITTCAGVEAEGAEANSHSKVILSSEGSDITAREGLDMDGTTVRAHGIDSDERTETVSSFSSPLTPSPPTLAAFDNTSEMKQLDHLVLSPLALPPPTLAAIDVPFSETEQQDHQVTDGVTPHSICSDDILVTETEEKKEMSLVLETISGPPATIVTVPEPAESFQPLEMKPSLPVLPPIWAESRQEVCETFDWFRSYQGGVYHADDYVKGYLLSGFPASRDRFEHGGKFIISHGGGRAESIHSLKGNQISVAASDQRAADKSVRALLNNYFHNRPLALLIDDKYALFPYDLGSKDITYAVLGFYTVAYAWAEYQNASNECGRVVRYKFAFRWCEEQGEPWWTKLPSNGDRTDTMGTKLNVDHQSVWTIEQLASACDNLTFSRNGTPLPGNQSSVFTANLHPDIIPNEGEGRQLTSSPLSTRCHTCDKDSPKVFSISWACLNADCPMFWRQTQSQELSFLPSNLAYESNFLQLPEYKNGLLSFADLKLTSPVHESAQGLGTGAMTDYHFTRGLHCRDCGRLSCRSQWEQWQCLNCELVETPNIPIRRAEDLANQTLPISFDYYFVNDISDITICPTITYAQQGGRGYLQTFILPGGRGKIHHIQARTRAAKVDADAIFIEYQEEARSGRMKFRRWPMRAHKCRGALLTNYFSHNAGAPYKYVGGDANTVPFDQAPAVCKARDLIQKRVYDALGISSTFNEVLSAAYMERQRMAFHSDNEVGLGPLVAGLSLGSPALMHFRLHARHDPNRKQRGTLLSVVLRHGDVLVMDGAGVQDFYEHTVVPNNFRIAATARQIGATHS